VAAASIGDTGSDDTANIGRDPIDPAPAGAPTPLEPPRNGQNGGNGTNGHGTGWDGPSPRGRVATRVLLGVLGRNNGKMTQVLMNRIERIRNDAGTIVGTFFSAPGTALERGFILTGHSYTVLDFEGHPTDANSINNAGQVVGSYDGGEHGFLFSDGRFSTIDFPGADITGAYGINDRGQIVGFYQTPTTGHGFIDTDGQFVTIDVGHSTIPYGINNRGDIVGRFDDNFGTHGFLLSHVPQPSTLLLMGTGLVCIAGTTAWIRRRGKLLQILEIMDTLRDTAGRGAWASQVRAAVNIHAFSREARA
jgi:probable HAF family extracellular repeat protein